MALPVRRTNELPVSDPLRELDDLQNRFTNLLESTLGGLPAGSIGAWTPPVDIEETDDAFVVEAELPGARPEDVNVELNDSQLVIHGEVKERERTGILRRRTRRTGEFDYRVTLPGQVDPEKVKGSLKDGVLRVELGKSEAGKARRVEISGG